MDTNDTSKRKPGRPPERVLGLSEVAEVLAVPARLPSWASEQIAEAMACAE